MRKEHSVSRPPNFSPPYWKKELKILDENGFGAEVARKVVVYYRWGQKIKTGRQNVFILCLIFQIRDKM